MFRNGALLSVEQLEETVDVVKDDLWKFGKYRKTEPDEILSWAIDDIAAFSTLSSWDRTLRFVAWPPPAPPSLEIAISILCDSSQLSPYFTRNGTR